MRAYFEGSPPSAEDVARALRRVMKRLNLRSQAELARQLGVSDDKVGRWLGGRGEVPATVLLQAARLVNTSVERLVRPDEELAPTLDELDERVKKLEDWRRVTEKVREDYRVP